MLDAMDDDPDLEPSGDDSDTGMPEGWIPSAFTGLCEQNGFVLEDDEFNGDHEGVLGAPERHPGKDVRKSRAAQRGHSQEHWASGVGDELESNDEDAEDGGDAEPDDSGYGDAEGMIEDTRGEYELGWTTDINQEHALPETDDNPWMAADGEPELGWAGHGVGYRDGDSLLDTEANGDELDWNAGSPCGNDNGIADQDAIASEEWGFAVWPGDGEGHRIADDMIRGLPIAAKRAAAISPLVPIDQPARLHAWPGA